MWKKYTQGPIVEARPYSVEEGPPENLHISPMILHSGSPKEGDMILRYPSGGLFLISALSFRLEYQAYPDIDEDVKTSIESITS